MRVIRLLLTLLGLLPALATADTLWKSDFESRNLDNWHYLLNKQGISISDQYQSQGAYAAKITVKGDANYLWHGKSFLNRVEMQYKPDTVADKGNTVMTWDVMFPELLSNARHEFAYWESDKSYQQIMRFDIAANRLSFRPSKSAQPLWQFNELKPQTWYSMAMHVHWSAKPDEGFVSLWFDGQQVLDKAPMATLLNEQEKAFIQFGILRDQTDKHETIWLDNVRELTETDNLLSSKTVFEVAPSLFSEDEKKTFDIFLKAAQLLAHLSIAIGVIIAIHQLYVAKLNKKSQSIENLLFHVSDEKFGTYENQPLRHWIVSWDNPLTIDQFENLDPNIQNNILYLAMAHDRLALIMDTFGNRGDDVYAWQLTDLINVWNSLENIVKGVRNRNKNLQHFCQKLEDVAVSSLCQ